MVVFEFTKECECVRGKSVKGLKMGAVHVQKLEQNFASELAH